MDNTKFLPYIIGGVATLILILYLSSSIFITIQSGQAGVLYKKFGGGTQTDSHYTEGFHIIAPWNTMYIYDVRTQENKQVMEALSRNGLTIKMDVSYRFKPQIDRIGILHREIGQNYAEKVIIPEIRSSLRKIIGKYNPEELYSSKRETIQTEVFESVAETINEKYLTMDALLISGIELPATIRTAIEKKLKQEQESQEYEFRLEKEQKEAQRKKIEAEGIREFQMIVSEGLNDRVLKLRGIEATLKLAESPNAKVVVVGGDDGMPLILGN
ncbi:MAG: prohibitin family protein [Cyclobacteriaceae bacterium]|nr:prohibitin family protein [Cyclobacteriaceae bacterium]MCH8516994.1 prohibitin family protein [Cyclobacteriaceae bacterium]